MKKYSGENLGAIAFPLGGIGTGSLSLAGNGILIDPEINNHPYREKSCGYQNFAIKAEKDGKVIDSRLIAGDFIHDIYGAIKQLRDENAKPNHGNTSLAGFKHFKDVTFEGAFPFAKITFKDESFPGEVTLEAFNPFIPSNDKDSSIPAAFFKISVKNTTDNDIDYSVLLSMTNVLENAGLNEYGEQGNLKMITLKSHTDDRNDITFGNITISTDSDNCSHQDYWYRSLWFDGTLRFSDVLNTAGPIMPRTYTEIFDRPSFKDTATLQVIKPTAAGETAEIKYLISWYVPKTEKYTNYYASLFDSSKSVAKYCFDNWERLYDESRRFADALYSSDLPDEVIDAISGNLAIIKSSTCLRLNNGEFWGWEGVNFVDGSCMGTCHHVWNYAYAIPFLFPEMERATRGDEYLHNLEDNGMMQFRRDIYATEGWCPRTAVDGQMGTIIKTYREWKLSGDNEWMRKFYPYVKRTLAFAWSPDNKDRWDMGKSGLITGCQHNTLDTELFGVNSWLTGFYHAALTAAIEMAKFMGDTDAIAEYTELLFKGRKKLDELTFNGEYYKQITDIYDPTPVFETAARYLGISADEIDPDNPEEKYPDSYELRYCWDKEARQVTHQIGDGCGIDQVTAAWHLDLLSLPQVYNPEHRKKALQSIYKYNFTEMSKINNPCRVYACNGEKGVIMYAWPKKDTRPLSPIPYSEECMTGFEYAVACNMLQCGMEDEALEIVRAVRERYDGKKRNPYSEIECGEFYARAMASYSFLLTYSGFKFDLTKGMIGFKPLKNGKYFWSVDGAWGTADCSDDSVTLEVLYGELNLKEFVTSLSAVKTVIVNDEETDFEINGDTVILNEALQYGDTVKFCCI